MDTTIKATTINFFKQLLSHEKTIIRSTIHSIRNNRSTTSGSYMSVLKREAISLGIINNNECLEDINTKLYKQTRRFAEIKPDDMYKIALMNELMMIRDKELYIDDDHFEQNDVLMTIDDLATN